MIVVSSQSSFIEQRYDQRCYCHDHHHKTHAKSLEAPAMIMFRNSVVVVVAVLIILMWLWFVSRRGTVPVMSRLVFCDGGEDGDAVISVAGVAWY